MPMNAVIRVGADVGGTFTDVVLVDGAGRVRTCKLPSTPPVFERAVIEAVARLLAEAGAPGAAVAGVAHGTTVATNAVLERRGARTALLTTAGFRDVLELRRVRAPQMYDLFWVKPPPLVERALRLELAERVAADGAVLQPLDGDELAAVAARLAREGVESVAVCLLHAYAYPEHERAVGRALAELLPGVSVSLSHEVLPERREYERSATTAVNAYVQPVMRRYLGALQAGLAEAGVAAPLLIMQSAGGLTPAEDAGRLPVYALESGPAAGVLAAAVYGRRAGLGELITLDIGGTTAKASLIAGGRPAYSAEYEVGASLSAGNRLVGGGGELIRAPSIDIAEIGAGGGSIAELDAAGGLRVGPRSAGAIPGPVCYGRGGERPTLTDANVVLGLVRPGPIADGQVTIDRAAAERAIADQIAGPLGLPLLEAADGIHRIANAHTLRALRAVSVERGYDPRAFTLVAFGGSGPLHAAALARELGCRRVVVPPLPGLFSAIGLLVSGVEHHDVRSCMLLADDAAPRLAALAADLRGAMLDRFGREGFGAETVALSWSVDARFRGQAYELRIPLPGEPGAATVAALHDAFAAEHLRLYGHAESATPVEVVALRLVGRTPAPELELAGAATAAPAGGERPVYFGRRWGLLTTPVVPRSALAAPAPGPLLVDEYDSTTVIPPDARAWLDEQGQIVMELHDAD
jgi:N-methylhydantoinase A